MGLVLDAGALIGYEREDRNAVGPIRRARMLEKPLLVPSPVLAQVWRDGARRARLATLLHRDVSEVVPLTAADAKAVGSLLARSGASDVVDAFVVWCARRTNAVVVTSDPDDLRRIDPRVRLETV